MFWDKVIKSKEKWREANLHTYEFITLWAANVCRFVLAAVFIFSGYVKAIDPLGTQYKIQDYLESIDLGGVLPDWITLSGAVGISTIEFSLGIFLLFAIRRRLVAKITVAFMAVMTLITLWLAVTNGVKDCGCFGDAIKLTNMETLVKNIVLLGCAAVIMLYPLKEVRFISRTNQWIAINYTVIFIIITSIYCLYSLPIFDFRPYHVGANIRSEMEIPDGVELPQFSSTFIMEKNGVRKEFTLDNYPDSTWTFIDRKDKQISEGFIPKITDFSVIRDVDGEDITQQILNDKGYTFLLIAPHLEVADDSSFGNIDQIYEYAQQENIPFYCLTASNEQAKARWQDITGAEYPFCTTDDIVLKTIIRSNPGLVLLKDGTVIRKWSHNELPSGEEFNAPLNKLSIGQIPSDNVAGKIIKLVLLFALPLILLSIADRIWAWSRWIKRKKTKKVTLDN